MQQSDWISYHAGHEAALVRSHMNGLLPFETNSPKTTAAKMIKQ